MGDTNVSPTDDIKIEVTETAKQPVTTEQKGGGEETPVKNDSPASEPKGVEDNGDKAGYVIEKLGNEKKALVQDLLSLAKENEVARAKVKAKLESDPSMEKYVKSKFGDDYDFIMTDAPAKKTADIDLEKIKEEARIQAKADVLEDQIKKSQDKFLEEKAKAYGFNTDEFEKFKRTVEALRGTGLDDESLVKKAALVVNDEKASAKPIAPSAPIGGGEAPKPSTKTVQMSQAMMDHAVSIGKDPKELARELLRVKEMTGLNDKGQEALILPGLKI